MSDMTSGVIYAPLFEYQDGYEDHKTCFCFDQAKRNLLHLVLPHVTWLGGFDAESDLIARDINEFMDRQTRGKLKQKPLTFMQYWWDLDNGELEIARNFPVGYIKDMKSVAAEWEAQSAETHVVNVSFRRSA